jgi:hypothetical protein
VPSLNRGNVQVLRLADFVSHVTLEVRRIATALDSGVPDHADVPSDDPAYVSRPDRARIWYHVAGNAAESGIHLWVDVQHSSSIKHRRKVLGPRACALLPLLESPDGRHQSNQA